MVAVVDTIVIAMVGMSVGAIMGVIVGLSWVRLTKTTSFEGYSGMLVWLTFMPIGAIAGAILGASLALNFVVRH
jgi:hypothetical protein